MCEERKWKKDIHIQLANMKYTDSCIEIMTAMISRIALQDSTHSEMMRMR